MLVPLKHVEGHLLIVLAVLVGRHDAAAGSTPGTPGPGRVFDEVHHTPAEVGKKDVSCFCY